MCWATNLASDWSHSSAFIPYNECGDFFRPALFLCHLSTHYLTSFCGINLRFIMYVFSSWFLGKWYLWLWSHCPMGPSRQPSQGYCSVDHFLVVFYFPFCVILCFTLSRSLILQAHCTGLGSLGCGDALRSSSLAGKHSATRIHLKFFPFFLF